MMIGCLNTHNIPYVDAEDALIDCCDDDGNDANDADDNDAVPISMLLRIIIII